MTDKEKALARKVLRLPADGPVTAEEVERALWRIEGIAAGGRVLRAIGKDANGETIWSVEKVQ
jgi:hypothetical protein